MSTDNINDLLKNPDQIKQMIGLLSALLETANTNASSIGTDIETEAKPKPLQSKEFNTKETKKKKTTRENKFLSMPEAAMYKEDPELAQKLYKQPPVARSRKPQMVSVTCRVCGKQEKVQSSLLYGGIDRFKCNKCSTTPG
jgi:hypothetical protein